MPCTTIEQNGAIWRGAASKFAAWRSYSTVHEMLGTCLFFQNSSKKMAGGTRLDVWLPGDDDDRTVMLGSAISA
jgi:hypothetical protein